MRASTRVRKVRVDTRRFEDDAEAERPNIDRIGTTRCQGLRRARARPYEWLQYIEGTGDDTMDDRRVCTERN